MEHDLQDGGVGTRRFRIWVQGRLSETFGEGLSGIEQEDVPAGTMLSGALLDQSQLHSILDLLRSLGIDVLRFEVDPPRPTCAGLAEETRGEPSRQSHKPPQPASEPEPSKERTRWT